MSKVTDQANEIIPSLRDEANDVVVVEDPFFSLKNTLFNFFENMLTKVQAEDDFMTRVKDALLEKIELGEITVAQLMMLLSSLNSDKLSLVDSILSIFKPTPGSGDISPLIDPNVHKNTDDGPNPFEDLSSKDREVIDKLSRVLEEAKTDPS